MPYQLIVSVVIACIAGLIFLFHPKKDDKDGNYKYTPPER